MGEQAKDETGAVALPCSRISVRPEWIDGNRHMNACYYLAAVKDPAIEAHDEWDYGRSFRARTGQSNFVLESQVVHFRELLLDDPIAVSTRILAMDNKRMRLLFEIRNEREDYLAALVQYLVIHVRMGPPPKASAMPDDLHARLSTIHAAHSRLPLPPGFERLSFAGKPYPETAA